MRRSAVTVAVVLAVLSCPVAAHAASCASPPAAGAVMVATPAEARSLGVARLGGLATGAGVRVAVLDSGVDVAHPQLQDAVEPGRDLLADGPDGRTDCVGHGTAVASLIAARPAPGVGMRGIAPSATVVPVRVTEASLDQESPVQGSPEQFAEAIDWAADPTGGNADVINVSAVLSQDDARVRAAVARAVDGNVVVVAAAGNEAARGSPVPYPAAYPGVIGVGALTPGGERAEFSQLGPYVDVVAPGAGVTAAAPGSGHRVLAGTSFAAPFVAGTAALVLERFPGATPAEVRRRLTATADPAPGGAGTAYGAGVLNPYRALTESLDARAPGPSSARPDRYATDEVATAARRERRVDAEARALLLVGSLAVAAVLALVSVEAWRRGRVRGWAPADQSSRT